jgi:RimJ/RimL family protein N-acetyltransferase
MRLDRVCCITQSENVRSTRVADRLGMSLTRTVNVPPDERIGALTAVVYEINAGEWLSTQRGEIVRS